MTDPANHRAVSIALALSSIVCGSLGQVALRAGARGLSGAATQVLVAALMRPAVLAGLVLYVLSSGLWLVVLSRMELSVAYPMGALNYVIVVGAAWAMGETIPAVRWGGAALVALGVVLVNLKPAREPGQEGAS